MLETGPCKGEEGWTLKHLKRGWPLVTVGKLAPGSTVRQ